MRQSTIILALSAVSSCAAVPVVKRADFDVLPGGDIDILNYALTLEYLERKFYREGLANYTEEDFHHAGFKPSFYENLKEIAYDEEQHVALLSGALGTAAVLEATYAFPSTDAKSFVGLASVLEGVGVSAYLGAAAVIADKTYVPIAGSILTVEARHSAYIRSALKQSPFPKPYDTPLNFNQVFSLAAQFITGFASGSAALPFTAFPPLTVAQGYKHEGVTFAGAYAAASAKGLVTADTAVFAVFFSGLDTYYAPLTVKGDDYFLAELPGADFSAPGQLAPSGQVYVVLSTANGKDVKSSDETTLSGVGILEI